MSPPYENAYRPVFSGWYWIYPSLELRRPIGGTHWTIESRVTYAMLDGVAGRSLNLNVYFGADRDPTTILFISRVKDIDPQSNLLRTGLVHKGMLVAANHLCRAPDDTLGVQNVEYFFRITRQDSVLSVDRSVDGLEFRNVFLATLPADVRARSQAVALTGDSWFAPAGAHADWDYIRFSVHRP
jgi:hypothetical protein